MFLRQLRCLESRTIPLLTLVYVLGVSAAFYVWDAFNTRVAEEIALEHAAQYSLVLMEFRTIYTSEVVVKARQKGLEVTHDGCHPVWTEVSSGGFKQGRFPRSR